MGFVEENIKTNAMISDSVDFVEEFIKYQPFDESVRQLVTALITSIAMDPCEEAAIYFANKCCDYIVKAHEIQLQRAVSPEERAHQEQMVEDMKQHTERLHEIMRVLSHLNETE